MGNFNNNRISPNIQRKKQNQLRNNHNLQVSRRNFRFISKVSTTGEHEQSVVWLAQNWEDSNEKFFVKKTNKQLAFRHGRVQSIKNELKILTKQNKNAFMIQPLFAFQDYCSLYLVHQFIDGFTLEQVLCEHLINEEEAKYIVIGIINIIQKLHQQKFAITQLCPNNIMIDRKTGEMKLSQLVNPLPIDSYYPSNMVIPLNQYSAPQILLMDRVLAQSDYYSLGLILYYIMKNKPAIPKQTIKDRMTVVNANIQVVKSDLPEGWKPEAADFLNPQLRLGRYGSFEVKNHPWLQNYSANESCLSSSISLSEAYFRQKKYRALKRKENCAMKKQKQQINQSYQFQIQFLSYCYKISQFQDDTLSYDSIQEQF